jgi:large subunit ribosomal protein L23
VELAKILISPVITEKSTNAQASQKYVFMVHTDSNKTEIIKAIKEAYGVDVKSVNIVPVLRKARLAGRGRSITRRKAGKKAIITLQAKQSLDFNKIKI